MSDHPVDAEGRVLPHPWWPRERQAPGELELVRRFCNSLNRENGADRFTTAEGFDRWLVSEGREPTHPRRRHLATIAALRDAIHAISVANQEHEPEPTSEAWTAIAALLTGTTFVLAASAGGAYLAPTARSATGAFLGDLVLVCLRADHDGTLLRLKSCTNCAWTIYDASKNRSGRWCSMSACGGRHNARTYRQRKPRR
jgi:predicted RNA-binding Zn ribbon-like protein